jgi:ubiquinone/menaquinone biosynthesis C-methylase UbiE
MGRACKPALALVLLASLVGGCDAWSPGSSRPSTAAEFPEPFRPQASRISTSFTDEDARDAAGEAEKVMEFADIREGMTVADIGAGGGYYTVRLAERVGEAGRVLAQDIDRAALNRLGARVEREGLENISIKLGETADPQLPVDSFDRIFLVHVYYELGEPYPFLWRMWPSLTQGGQVIVVEANRPLTQNGIPPELLFCEFQSVGFKLVEFANMPEVKGYFARFEREQARPNPTDIEACTIAL